MTLEEILAAIEEAEQAYKDAIAIIREHEDLAQRIRGKFDLLMELKVKEEKNAKDISTTGKSSKRTGK